MKGTTWRLLKLAAPLAGWMALAALLGAATVASSIGLLSTSGYLIARAALRPSIADLQVAIVGVRFFGISRGVLRYLERYVSHQATFRLLSRLRVWFYTSVEPLAPARLLAYRSGDLLARIVADIETLENFYLRVIAPPAVALLTALLLSLLLGSFDPGLILPPLAFYLLAGLGLPLLTGVLGRRAGQEMIAARAELNSTLLSGLQGMADLLAFGGEGQHLAGVQQIGRRLSNLQGHMGRVAGLHSALSGLLMNLATLAILAAAIPLVNSGRLDGVYLALLVLAVMASFEAVQPLPQAFQYLENSLAAADRLFEIVDAPPAVVDPGPGEGGGTPPRPGVDGGEDGLRVSGLRFAYAPGAAAALDGLSFDLPPGKWLAVVGPSGAGKSTLAHLLLRFWEYDAGHILLDGQELRDYPQEEVRRRIAVVSQQTHLFNATVRQNLLLARPGASESELIRAAELAYIHDFIQSLPQGYDTWLGEQGLHLSGGQRQRLAIARAILQEAPILILDEPTANLDALTERQVVAALQTLDAGRATLWISHRPVGLEAADEILVLRAGRIVERGRHHDLVQMAGLYRQMWELQNQILEGGTP